MATIKVGTFIADGNDVTLPIGFVPDHFTIINTGVSDTETIKIEWYKLAGVGNEFISTYTADGNDVNHDWITTGDVDTTVTSGTVQTTGTVQVTGAYGIIIDESFMDDSDVCYYTAIKADAATNHGDINA